MSANQFNRGATLLVDRDEKARVGRSNCAADEGQARWPMRPRAYILRPAWPCSTKATGAATRFDVHLWLERAECEYLTGQLASAESRPRCCQPARGPSSTLRRHLRAPHL